MDTFQRRNKRRKKSEEPMVKVKWKKLIVYGIVFFSIIIGMGACQIIVGGLNG